jgi:hypothetical protein
MLAYECVYVRMCVYVCMYRCIMYEYACTSAYFYIYVFISTRTHVTDIYRES